MAAPPLQHGALHLTVARPRFPSATTFVGASGGGTVSSGVVQWALGTLSPGSVGQRQLTVSVAPGTANGNTVAASAEIRDDTDQSLARATASTVVRNNAQIALAMTANPDPVHPGERIVYALTVSNVGASTLTGVTLTDLVPNNTTVARIDISAPGACPFGVICLAGSTLSWSLGSLAPGLSRTVQFTAVVDTNNAPAAGTVIHNSASVSADATTGASASRDVLVAGAAGLELGIVDDPDPVAPGALLTYTLTFGNPGNGIVPATVLRATLPPGTVFVGASGGGSVSGGAVQWSIGPLAAGATGQRQFTVTVSAGAVNGSVVIKPMMYVALSYDHRIIDGQQAVLFLVRIKELMEDPATMLIN